MDIDIKEIRKKNLQKIIDRDFHGSVHAFARRVKRPSGFFYDVFAGRRPLGERIMRAIEAELGLVPHELDASDSEFKEKRFELVNVYGLKLSAGVGNEVCFEGVVDEAPVSATLIRKNGWKHERLCCFNIDGNSMEPTLQHGSRVLVNTHHDDIIDSKIYAISKGNNVFIKRLYKVFNEPKIIAKSDNPIYPELYIDLTDEKSDFKIIGMAVLRLEEPL
jgi:phage repressor protein C with HTH and peptisase S24 domain